MKLLICTQTVDSTDPILGFFMRWIEELANRVESVEVICLRSGTDILPQNVRVHPLTRGKRQMRLRTAFRLLRLAWRLRSKYDTVFVHMNPEYLIVTGGLWSILKKRVTLWYNHPYGGLRLSIAARWAQIIFHTSPHAASASYEKAKRMPAGIDTTQFIPTDIARVRTALYIQGRVTPSKRIHVALEALRLLRKRFPTATLTIVGPEAADYDTRLRRQFDDLVQAGAAAFLGSRHHSKTPELFCAHGITINLAASGHFDKVVLESMACETPVIVGSQGFEGLVPAEWVVSSDDPKALAEALERMLLVDDAAYRALGSTERDRVLASQSLSALADALVSNFRASVAL